METSLLHHSVGNSVYPADRTRNSSEGLEYSYFLKRFNRKYTHQGSYLKVGEIPQGFGWVIYVSVIRQEMHTFMGRFLENPLSLNCSFTVPATTTIHTMLLDGSFGHREIGKIITIYPETKEAAKGLVNELIKLAEGIAGPVIPSAIPLDGIVFTDFIPELSPAQKPKWPFHPIKENKIPKPGRWIGKYLIAAQLKGDAKGNVYKCLNFNDWRNIHWCVVKQGLAHQCSDDFGRTIKDRLEWQYELLQWLTENKIPLSKPIEYFEHKNDGYLVIEYIEGINLNDKISRHHRDGMWIAMPIQARRELLRILLDVVSIVDHFHGMDTFHRDLNPENFLVRADGSVVGIDIELACDECPGSPEPPYTPSIPDYCSPQQLALHEPELEDDYYGLGALMLKAFTGHTPTELTDKDEETIFKTVKFYTGNTAMASLVSRCLSGDPQLRPKITSIRHKLAVYNALLLKHSNAHPFEPQKPNKEKTSKIKAIIQRVIKALTISKSAALFARPSELHFRYLNIFITALKSFCTAPFHRLLTTTYNSTRIFTRNIHDRKNALFPGGTSQSY